MPSELTGRSSGTRFSREIVGGRSRLSVKTYVGVGMLEFLIALLVFSMGMVSLIAAQVTGKKTIFEASQHSVATALARDILERMRANPSQLVAYQIAGLPDENHRLVRPDTDCDVTVCTTEQLAAFDLWQWQAQLLGHSEQDSVGNVGGLLEPQACITSDGGDVDVTISWRGVMTVEPSTQTGCGVAVDGESESEEGEGEAPQRNRLTVSTFIVGK